MKAIVIALIKQEMSANCGVHLRSMIAVKNAKPIKIAPKVSKLYAYTMHTYPITPAHADQHNLEGSASADRDFIQQSKRSVLNVALKISKPGENSAKLGSIDVMIAAKALRSRLNPRTLHDL